MSDDESSSSSGPEDRGYVACVGRSCFAGLAGSENRRHVAGVTDAAQGLLTYLGSQENVVARLSRSHAVFAGIGLQRSIISFLAFGERPLALVVGPEGTGKTFLLAMVERHAREAFPLLSIHASYHRPGLSSRNRAVNFLREILHAHMDSQEVEALSPNELLHNGAAFLNRVSAEVGGLLLIIDDADLMLGGALPNWLPTPLPPGLHCILSAKSEEAFTGADMILDVWVLHVWVLGCLSAPEQQQLLSQYAPHHQEPALSTLSGRLLTARACCLMAFLVALKPDSRVVQSGTDDQAEMAKAYLHLCEERHGEGVQKLMTFLYCACHGLHLADLEVLCEMSREEILQILDFCRPLLRENLQVYCLDGDFALRAVGTFISEEGLEMEERENDLRLSMVPHLTSAALDAARTGAVDTERCIEEAVAQLSKVKLGWPTSKTERSRESCVCFVTSLPVLRHLAVRSDELIALWRKVRIDEIAKRLLEAASEDSWTTQDQTLAGRLLSTAGEFATARELLSGTLNKLHITDPFAHYHRAEILVAIANNEVRYWDSHRNWSSPDALKLLLDSGQEAVQLLERLPLSRPGEKLQLARALSRRANGCFKAGCVSDPGGSPQTSYFDESDACIAKAVALLQGQRLQILGELVLVGGVTTLCRAHSFKKRRLRTEALETAITSMVQFYRAEAILRSAVGNSNEKSIFTHGNLAELFLYDLQQPFLSLLHHRQSCIVAVRVFGCMHANAKKKLQELALICDQSGWPDFAQSLQIGRPEDICPSALCQRLLGYNIPFECRHNDRIGFALAQEAYGVGRPLDGSSSASAVPEFWNCLWEDLGVPDMLADACSLPPKRGEC